MLTELRVRDLAVIADVTLPMQAGFNVLTGETGAGKSMLVDALALLLGERGSSDVIRPGAVKTVIEGAFEVHGRLLHARDGLALWDTSIAEIEALSNDAIILLVELSL